MSTCSWVAPATAAVLARVGDREVGADPLAGHAGLAGRDVLARGDVDDQVAREARSDVLDLADDAQPVLAVQVELGDLVALVLDLVDEVARRRLVGGELAARRRWR